MIYEVHMLICLPSSLLPKNVIFGSRLCWYEDEVMPFLMCFIISWKSMKCIWNLFIIEPQSIPPLSRVVGISPRKVRHNKSTTPKWNTSIRDKDKYIFINKSSKRSELVHENAPGMSTHSNAIMPSRTQRQYQYIATYELISSWCAL